MSEVSRLITGSGGDRPADWINADLADSWGAEVRSNIVFDGLLLGADSVYCADGVRHRRTGDEVPVSKLQQRERLSGDE